VIKIIDNFLNSITMYRLILYALGISAGFAVLLAYLDAISLPGNWLLVSAAVLLAVCLVGNKIFAAIFKAPTNVESAAITALILFFVISPAYSWYSGLGLAAIGALATASKYLLAINKKHLFNPAAVGAVLGGLLGLGASSWWISQPILLPLVVVLGFLVVRKLRRFKMFFAFIAVSLVAGAVFSAANGGLEKISFTASIVQPLLSWPLVFFGTIMLTEPLTTPPTKKWRLVYAAIVGVLFGLPLRFGSFYLTAEAALVIGNLFSFLVSFKQRLVLRLKGKQKLAPKIIEFIFTADRRFAFLPGQYLEWTLAHRHADNRGNRRYFTIASSPTEPDIHLVVKIFEQSSSYKKALSSLNIGDRIVAGQLDGEFTLPKNPEKKIVFIAGGIGITPFRSMLQYIIDTKQKRDVVLLYAATNSAEFVYQEIFTQAEQYGVKTVYVVTARTGLPTAEARAGRIDRALIESEITNYQQRTYYLSGPPGMVTAYRELLLSLGIGRRQIKTDYFPGY